jgi:sugar phosphate permease
MAFILYLDRLCLGQTAPFLQKELGLSNGEMGFVHASFTVAYGLFEIVTGHWGDRYGCRGVLTRIVLWWSVFTALTGTASGFVFLLIVRFLFGAGEAGAYPNAARITTTWFPPERRGAVRGAVNMPALLGGMVAPPATAYLIEAVGWRWVFAIYGLLGVAWTVIFWWWYRDRPADHWRVNEAELALIGPPPRSAEHEAIPWRSLLLNRNVWLLGTVIITGAATVYTLFSWYPSYLMKVHGLSNQTAGWLTGSVMLGGALGCLVGGWISDIAARILRGSRWARSSVGACAYALAAASMLAGVQTEDPIKMSVGFALACFFIHGHAGVYWGAAADIGGRHVAALFAAVNSIGAFGGGAAQVLFGFVPREKWETCFGVCGVLLAFGAICWSLVDARQPMREPDAEH